MNPRELNNAPGSARERKVEAGRIVKRLSALVAEHRQAAVPLRIELSDTDVRAVIAALRDHADGGSGTPVPGARDDIHAHVLNRLFDELVEEPSNILFAKPNADGSKPSGYQAMDVKFWRYCLDAWEVQLRRRIPESRRAGSLPPGKPELPAPEEGDAF